MPKATSAIADNATTCRAVDLSAALPKNLSTNKQCLWMYGCDWEELVLQESPLNQSIYAN